MEDEKKQKKQKTFEVVVQAEGVGGFMWSHDGTVHIASEAAAFARFAADISDDEKTPTVAFAAPQGLIARAASKVLAELQPEPADGEDACAVHLVLRIEEHDSEGLAAAVFPPDGRPRLAQGAEAIGNLLHELASDSQQPKVRPGAPPDVAEGLFERGLGMVGEYLSGKVR